MLVDIPKIILASGSPRRKELMAMAGFDFEVRVKNTDETHPLNTLPQDIPALLAERKAMAFYDETIDEIIIAADTIVIIGNEILEKPSTMEEAIAMLQKLSGKKHDVVTGVCILTKQKKVVFSEQTAVYFNTLTLDEITFYIDKFKPYDKAGGYACQEWIGAIGIARFEGSYHNVVGLPTAKLYTELKSFLGSEK